MQRWFISRLAAGLVAGAGLLGGLGLVVVGVAANGASPQALGDGLEHHAYLPGIASDEPGKTPPSPSPTASKTPTKTATATKTATPTATPTNQVTLAPFNGFRFNPPGAVQTGHDFWWTGSNLVSSSEGMQSLGIWEDYSLVPEPPEEGYAPFSGGPSVMEAFAVKVPVSPDNPHGGIGVIWVVSKGNSSLTFRHAFIPNGACGGATALITALDRDGFPETVTIEGEGDLTGWYLVTADYDIAHGGKYTFPNGFNLGSQGGGVAQVQIISNGLRLDYPDTPSRLWWYAGQRWKNDTTDTASLYNCEGTLVQTFDEP